LTARSGFAWYLPIGPLPADGIDLLHQDPKEIKRIAHGRGDLHCLSRSSISAIEELTDCRNPGCLALCLHMLRHACGFALAGKGHDTRALQAYLGHRNIQHTVRYTELSPDRFKNFWR
jgi:integrase